MKHLIKAKITFTRDELNNCTVIDTIPMWLGSVNEDCIEDKLDKLNELERKICALKLGVSQNSPNLPTYIFYVQNEEDMLFSRHRIINMNEYWNNKEKEKNINLSELIISTEKEYNSLTKEDVM